MPVEMHQIRDRLWVGFAGVQLIVIGSSSCLEQILVCGQL